MTRSLRLRAGLLCVAVACCVAGGVFLIRTDAANESAAGANRAVVDTNLSHDVIAQVSTGLNAILSYRFDKPAVASQAAAHWLTGDAVAQYKLLFTELNKRAPGQQLSFVAKVVTAGVVSLTGHSAELLVFLDQRSTRASDHQSSVAAAQVQIIAVQRGKLWQISELRPL